MAYRSKGSNNAFVSKRRKYWNIQTEPFHPAQHFLGISLFIQFRGLQTAGSCRLRHTQCLSSLVQTHTLQLLRLWLSCTGPRGRQRHSRTKIHRLPLVADKYNQRQGGVLPVFHSGSCTTHSCSCQPVKGPVLFLLCSRLILVSNVESRC